MDKQIKIALAGNPNCGKTTLFNALTGSNQFVGNWPGVTVEKKEGKLKKHDNVIIMDLPGIYSLSPYTLEEVVSRNYLITERPDAILNIIDGTNLERNLYLTTQLTELGIPVVIAINMMDVVRKNGDQINVAELSRELGVRIIEISALKGDGVMEAAEAAARKAALPAVEVEPQLTEKVDFDTFCKSDFRAVKVKACEAVKKSEKLLRFTLDDGTGTDRQILSGIHKFYEPEELVDKTLVAIVNLPPRKMMGLESNGMLISAVHTEHGEECLHLIMVDDSIPAGAKLC